jgi:NitT/TauT family transport system ATP-binding protein
VSFDLPRGGFLAILGPSGCGKSTLLRVVADLVRPASGGVSIFGRSPSEARRARELGFVFQDAALLPWRTVRENVELPLEVGGSARASRSASKAEELLELVGLSKWLRAYPHELSGGMRQRVSIARALVTGPKILLMDEPFGALDEITRDRLNDELRRIWRETGTTILFVTHSIPEALYLGERVLMLAAHPGRVREMVTAPFPSMRDLSLRESSDFVKKAGELRGILETCG